MMEIEVSKKIREAIKAKLIEMGSHVDDELPDYIMILIANRRSQQDLEADLELFLGDNTKKFVNWMTNVLKKLEQVTADTPGGSAGGNDEINIDGDDGEGEENLQEGGEQDELSILAETSIEEPEPEPPVVEQPIVVNNTENVKEGKSGEEKRSRNRSSTSVVVAKVEEKPIKETSETKKKLSLKRNDPVKVPAAPVANKTNKTTDKTATVSKPLEKEKVQVSTPPMDDLHNDTLILDTEENEFDSCENVDELRRIALQSQEERKQRKNSIDKSPPKIVHQRTLIKSILLGRVKEDRDSSNSPRVLARTTSTRSGDKDRELLSRSRSSRPDNSSSRRESYRSRTSSRSERSPVVKILRSPRRKVRSPERSGSGFGGDKKGDSSTGSVFSRIGRSTRRSPEKRSKTRSRSPIRTMTSRIGSVIRRSSSPEEDSPARNSLSSVVKVTNRPKRDLRLSGKMLLRAVADAQQSIIKTEQKSPTPRTPSSDKRKQVRDQEESHPHRKRPNSASPKQVEVSPKLSRFANSSPSRTKNYYKNTNEMTMEESPPPRISVKDRLGVKQEQPRRSVKDRLGVIQNFNQSSNDPYDIETYSPGCDYKILVNVSDDTNATHQRNVLLAANDLKRISIQVNNSEDSSDESSEMGNGSPTAQTVTMVNLDAKKKNEQRKMEKESVYLGGSDSELQLVMSEEDKLPEVPNGTQVVEEEYEEEYEEIVEEEDEENAGESSTQSTQDLSQASTMSSQEHTVSITINKVIPSNPVTTLKTSLPDLRTLMSRSKPSPMAPSITNNNNNNGSTLKCKFWPSCQFKDKCIYEHPKCKFDPCTKKDCIYKHELSIAPQKSPQGGGKIVCKWYPKCTSMNCKFHHPSPCRFGMGCTDARCENYHPGVHLGMQKLKAKGVPLIPKGSQLKWVKK